MRILEADIIKREEMKKIRRKKNRRMRNFLETRLWTRDELRQMNQGQ